MRRRPRLCGVAAGCPDVLSLWDGARGVGRRLTTFGWQAYEQPRAWRGVAAGVARSCARARPAAGRARRQPGRPGASVEELDGATGGGSSTRRTPSGCSWPPRFSYAALVDARSRLDGYIADALFNRGGRDFESIGLGWFEPASLIAGDLPLPADAAVEAVRSAVRLLALSSRYPGNRGTHRGARAAAASLRQRAGAGRTPRSRGSCSRSSLSAAGALDDPGRSSSRALSVLASRAAGLALPALLARPSAPSGGLHDQRL